MEHDDWTLTELVAAAAKVLDERDLERVDARTVRYWRSAGVVSEPTGAGRGARWGWRHLCEIVAARAAQGEGRTVAEIAQDRAEVDAAERAAAVGLAASHPEGFEVPAGPPARFWDPAAGPEPSEPSTAAAAPSPPAAPLARRSRGLLRAASYASPVPAPAPVRSLVELDGGAAVALPTWAATPEGLARLTPIFEQLTATLTALEEDR